MLDTMLIYLLLAIVAPVGIGLWIKKENKTDWGNRGLNILDGINRIYCKYYHGLKSDALHLPESGSALLVANHISGIDPMALIAASHRPLRFIIAEEQYNRFGLKWLFKSVGCIPVNRQVRPERAMREAIRRLRKGEVVALFPQGGITLFSDEKTPLKAGVVRLARIAKCPIIPAHIDGVKGIGHVFRSVIYPGKITIQCHDPIAAESMQEEEILQLIAQLIKHQ